MSRLVLTSTNICAQLGFAAESGVVLGGIDLFFGAVISTFTGLMRLFQLLNRGDRYYPILEMPSWASVASNPTLGNPGFEDVKEWHRSGWYGWHGWSS
jgi:hypothetical protein